MNRLILSAWFLVGCTATILHAAGLEIVPAGDARIEKTGSWQSATKNKQELIISATPGDRLRFKFNGVSVGLVLRESPQGGRCAIKIDGQPVKNLEALDTARWFERNNDYLVSNSLPAGEHVLELEVSAGNDGKKLVQLAALKCGDFAFSTIEGTVYPPVSVARSHYPVPDQVIEIIKENGDKPIATAVSADDLPSFCVTGLEAGKYTVRASSKLWPLCRPGRVTIEKAGQGVADVIVSSRTIWSPNGTAPALVLKGQSFPAQVFTSRPGGQWSASLSNGYKSLPLAVKASEYDEKLGLEKLSLTVPADAPAELFSLTLKSAAGAETVHRAVQVLREFKTKFSIVHESDAHVGTNALTDMVLRKEIDEINLIHPEFVVITGDNSDSISGIPAFLSELQSCQVPTFAVTGNHDAYSDKIRNAAAVRYYGDQVVSFDYGALHAAGYDDGYTHNEELIAKSRSLPQHGLLDSQTIDWLKQDFENHPQAQFRLQFCHIGGNYWRFLDDLTDHRVNVLLSGHAHQDMVKSAGATPTLMIRTRTNKQGGDQADAKDAAVTNGGYRLLRINANRLETWTYNNDPTLPLLVPHSLNRDEHALTLKLSAANDGTQASLTATIHNAYKERFESAQLRFITRRGTPKASKGNIVETYDSDDGSKTITTISVDIPPETDQLNVTLTSSP